MLNCKFVSKILFSSVLALSISMPAFATYTINSNTTLSDNPTYSNNNGNGIQTSGLGSFNVNVDGTINVNNNTGQGISIYNGSNVNFIGATDGATININNSGQRGLQIFGNSTVNMTNINLNISDSGSGTEFGICSHGVLNMTGNGNNIMQIGGNNTVSGLHIHRAVGTLINPITTITDMNVNISDNNQYGILSNYEAGETKSGTLNISSTTGNNTLQINRNKLDGILVQNGQLNFSNMNIEVLNNGANSTGGDIMARDGGIEVFGKATITGNGNTMNVSNNTAYGMAVKQDTTGAESGLVIQDMNATFNGNGGVGLYTENVSGTIESTNGTAKNLIANNNGLDGFNFQGNMTINNMNVQANQNGVGNNVYDGIENTKNLTINGNGQTWLQANGNGGAGITTYSSGNQLNIKDMNIELSGNTYGLVGGNGAVNITSTNGNNVLSITNNTDHGLSVSGDGSSLNIENMDVEIKNNGNIGMNVQGSTLHISSASGNNKMIFDGNDDRSFYAINTNTTVDKMNIYISNTISGDSQAIGMCAHGIFEMTGNGSNVLYIDTSVRGLHIANSVAQPHEATIKDYNISITNNTMYGIWANDSIGTISSTNKNNTIYFAGNGKSIYLQSTGGTNATNTGLNINGMQMVSNDAIFATVEGSASFASTLNMQDSNLRLTGANQIVYDLNKGVLTLSNVTQTGATPTTLVLNTGTSSFSASNNSSMIGKITDNGQLTGSLNSGSTWKMLDTSNTYNMTLNNSSVDMRSLTGGYNTLTVGNAYLADNATLYMNTNMDETQLTDQLVLLDGSHIVGKTNLNITNTAPATSYGTFIKGDGIKVVDAQGSTFTGADSFDLVGKKIDTGLYIQELYYQNLDTSDESWYIRTATEDDGGGNKGSDGSNSNGNKPKPTDLTKTVANMPAVALSVVKTINSELRNRLGELRSNNPKAHNGLWARGYMKSLEVDEKIKNEMDIYGFEAGYDHLISKDSQTRTYLGIMAGYAQVDKIKVDQDNGYKGKGDGSVPSVGAYLTWINKNGWYTDTVIRGFLTKLDITNYSAQGLPITYDADRMAVAGSFEFGRRTSLYQKGRNGFIVEPKAQVVYTYMPSKDHKTSLGQKIKYDTTQSLVTRAALMAAYRRTFANGMALEPYIQVGIAYEWLGKTDVNFIGSDFTSDVSGATFEGVLGINARLSRGWHLYGDFTLEKGSIYDSYGGHLGVRYNF